MPIVSHITCCVCDRQIKKNAKVVRYPAIVEGTDDELFERKEDYIHEKCIATLRIKVGREFVQTASQLGVPYANANQIPLIEKAKEVAPVR